RTTIEEYRKTRRGSKGVRTTSAKYARGRVVAVKVVEPEEHLLATTKAGIVIRCPVADISVKGRATRGVRLQRLEEGDEVVAVARVLEEEEQDEALGSEPAPKPDTPAPKQGMASETKGPKRPPPAARVRARRKAPTTPVSEKPKGKAPPARPQKGD